MSTKPVLWQFKYSHYNDKARWALDFKEIRHIRESLLPGAHLVPMLLRTGQKQVPVLEIDGKMIPDSTQIIATLEESFPKPALYPKDPVLRARALELEDYFDRELGPALRVAWFQELFSEPGYVAKQLSVDFPGWNQSLFQLSFPITQRVMRFDMGINESSAKAARQKLSQALDRLETEIQPSGYLVGDSFSVADLTAAALLSPIVMPPQFPYPMLNPLPAAAAKWRDSLVQRRGVQWAADMYTRHRGSSAAVGE